MFYVFKLLLIILFNGTYAYINQDNEIILLPAWKPTDTKEIQLTLKTFKKQIQLSLRRNDQIVSFAFKDKLPQSNVSDSCYYFHTNQISTAVINFCDNGWKGVVSLKESTLEIRPLRNDFTNLSLIDNLCVKEENNLSFGQPHLIKRSLHSFSDSSFYYLNKFKEKLRYVRNTQKILTIELAVFFDEAAYRAFMPYFNENKVMLRGMILAYVSRIQAVFHHPSLGAFVNISLVHLEIMEKQPLDLPTFDVHDELLHSFCKYSKRRNSLNDNDPGHWDIGLYLTGINIYTKENFDILGGGYFSSVCELNSSCVIAEFGVENEIYTGFTASYIAAHEIGYALGIDLDSRLGCDKDKYIMSDYSNGQVTWSECSRKVAENLWLTKQCLRDRTKSIYFEFHHSLYHDLPGRKWTAKAQCELFYRDKDANVVSHDVCNNLQCETPNNYRDDFTGPALEGTHCAYKKECRGGECVPIMEPPYLFKYCKRDIWSEWKDDSCRSNCLEESKGVRIKRRYCKHLAYRTANCAEPYYDVTICDDYALCSKKRRTITEFTTRKCRSFSRYITELEAEPGIQAVHEIDKPWLACTILCKQKLLNQYVPSFEMLNFHIDPYFPDGTWCHNEDGQNYYCRQHYCLPENYSKKVLSI